MHDSILFITFCILIHDNYVYVELNFDKGITMESVYIFAKEFLG